jgi:hypothetical protein
MNKFGQGGFCTLYLITGYDTHKGTEFNSTLNWHLNMFMNNGWRCGMSRGSIHFPKD